MGRHLSPRYGQVILVSGYPVLTAVNWSQHWCPICVHYQFSCAPKLAKKIEIEHWSRCIKTINWWADSFQIYHVTSMSRFTTDLMWVDTWDRSVAILFWQLSIDHILNVKYKRCGFAKTHLRYPSLLLILSPTPPVQSVDAYVRTYARSITWQPNEKMLAIFYKYGALSQASFARLGAPLLH